MPRGHASGIAFTSSRSALLKTQYFRLSMNTIADILSAEK